VDRAHLCVALASRVTGLEALT